MTNTKLTRLEKFLPKVYQPKINPFIKCLLSTWANELEEVQTNIDETKKQIFVSLAQGKYLAKCADNYGVNKPTHIIRDDGSKEIIPGLADSKFRQLIPILSFYPKQVKNTIISALDLFWGPTYTRATVYSAGGEFYNLTSGDILDITVDKKTDVSVTFLTADFVDINNATADEIVTIINRTTDLVTAESYYNYNTSTNHVRIYTNTVGTDGAIQVTGGTANTILQFPTLLEQFIKVGVHEIENNEIIFKIPEDIPILLDSLKGSHHFKEGSLDFFLTSIVMESDLHYLKSFNLGSLIEQKSLGGASGSGVDEFNYPGGVHMDDDYIYICDNDNQRILKKRLRDFSSIASAGTFGGLDLLMPVGITGDQFYLYVTDAGRNEVIKINKSDLTFDSRYGSLGSGNDELYRPAGIVVSNGKLFICDMQNHRIMVRNSVGLTYNSQIGSLGSGNNEFHGPVDIETDDSGFIYISDYENSRVVKRSSTTLAYESEAPITDCASLAYDENGRQLILSDWVLGLSETVRVWDLSLAEKKSAFIDVGDVGVGAITASPTYVSFNATIDPNWPGSFLYDYRQTFGSFTITKTKTLLKQNVLRNTTYPAIEVDDTTDFNSEGGYLCFEFGKTNQEALVPYLGKATTQSLIIHPAYKFINDHDVDATVHHVEKWNYVHKTNGDDYAVYMINPNIAKELVTQLVNLIKAAGITLRFEIDYTEYKYEDINNL